MNKKLLTIISLIFFCSFIVACVSIRSETYDSNHSSNNQSTGWINQYSDRKIINLNDLENPRLIVDEPYFKLYIGDNFKCYYYIYDSTKKIVDEGGFIGNIPNLSMINNDVVSLEMNMGTGITWNRYYSITRDVFTKEFYYVVAFDNEYIAYIDVSKKNPLEGRSLIVRNAFNKEEYYKRIDLNFSKVDTPILYATFMNNGTQLQVIYVKGENFQQITEIIDLD